MAKFSSPKRKSLVRVQALPLLMEISIFLAKVIGLFVAISALAILARYKKSLELQHEAAKSPIFIYTSGFSILILGVLLVVSHSVWVWDWRLIITILGWAVLFKGTLRIFFPDIVRRLIEKKKGDRRFMLAEVGVLLVGLYLVYKGFFIG